MLAPLEALFAAQRDRWILWLPAAAIVGAAGWLAADAPPPGWIAPTLAFAGAAAAMIFACWPTRQPDSWRRRILVALAGVCAAAAFLGLGAGAAQLRTQTVAAPRLMQEIGPVFIDGWVEEVEIGAPRTRLRLLVRSVEGMAAPPRFLRVTTPGARAFTAGRAIRCRAILRPPDGPLAPGGYDFARRAYFEKLGATGFTYGRCRPVALGPAPGLWDRAHLTLAAIRSDIAESIHAVSPGPGAAIAASLIVGDRSFIDEATNVSLRDSGLGHILSVSGLHMSVVGGLVFAALSYAFALIAPIALRVPVKKLAAAGGLLVLTLYLFISGASVPAIRAYVMAAVAFGAILIDRPGISMRGLALAAFIIVLTMPESVLEPGFQMSFAATAALVAAFEAWPRDPMAARLPTPGPIVGGLQAIARGVGGALLISFVAGLATDPFALFHFQRYAVYSLPANLVASPLVSFVIAPAAALAAIGAPFGLAEWPLKVMAQACEFLAGLGAAFADRPEAVNAMPKPPNDAFLLAVFAIAWGCLWRGALRWLAAPLFAAAIALYAAAPRPAVLFDGELRAVLARDAGGDWTLLRPFGRSTFARDRLGAMAGLAPHELERLAPPEACDEFLCEIALANGARIVIALRPEGLADPRTAGAILLSRHAAPRINAPAQTIAARNLARYGGGTITEFGRTLAIVRARPSDARPWTERAPSTDEAQM